MPEAELQKILNSYHQKKSEMADKILEIVDQGTCSTGEELGFLRHQMYAVRISIRRKPVHVSLTALSLF